MSLKFESASACHQICLLSLWSEHASTPWRATLRSSSSEERSGFAGLKELAKAAHMNALAQYRFLPPVSHSDTNG